MQRDLPLILGVLAALFVLSIASEQCYVGQKLFSMEANRAVCAPLVPYPCVAKCEWVANCSASQSWKAFKGRRSYISGLLINSRSLLVLCCTSLATIVKSRKQCSWRPYESLPVIGPSIRLDPVLGQHSYIREAVMTRESEGRVGIRIEVCKFKRERQNCKIENMSETEKKRFEKVRNRWARAIGADPDVLFGKKKEEKVEKDAKAGGDEKAKEIDAKKAEEKKLDKFAEDAFTTDQPEIIEEKTEGAAEVQPFPAEKGVTAEFGATTDAPEFGSSTSSDDLVTATAESGSGDLITATASDDGVTSLVDLFVSTASPDFESTSGTPEEGSAFRIIDDPINESGSGAPATEAPEEFSGAFQSTEAPVEGSGATAATETEFGASTIEPLSETATAIIEETTNVNEEAATTGAAADFEVATTAAGDSFAAESTTPAFDEDANDFPLISAA